MQKSKTDSEFSPFPSAKFRKTWQTGRLEYQFTLVGARFSGKSMGAVFFYIGKRQNFAKIEKTASKNSTFWCLKLVSRRMRCAVKILKDFTEENSRKSQMKP